MTPAGAANRIRTRWLSPLTVALAFAVLMAADFGAMAGAPVDPVPNPRPRPAGAPQATAVSVAPAQSASAAVLRRPASGDPLVNINNYFNSFRTMEGQFIQFGPNGEQSEGVFFMTRPGRIRFHYNPPSKLDVVSDGSSVAIKDGRTRTQDLYPLNATPLRYLLSDRIDLTSANIVRGIREEADLISLVIADGSAQGKLTLIFDRKTYALRQWVVTDAQGLNTSVAIYNTATGKPQNPNLFRITPGRTF